MNQDILIRVDHLHVVLGRTVVIRDLSLQMVAEEMVLFTGPNGSGKSTALKALAGLIKSTGGQVNLKGQFCFVPQRQALFQNLSLSEQIRILVRSAGPKLEDQFMDILQRWMPLPDLSRLAKSFSTGEQRLIALAISLARKPEVLLLDEPFASLKHATAEIVVKYLKSYIRDMRSCAVVAEHRMGIAAFDHQVTFPH